MGHEKVDRLPFAFAFGYCIKFCIYAMLRTRATFSWPILYMHPHWMSLHPLRSWSGYGPGCDSLRMQVSNHSACCNVGHVRRRTVTDPMAT